MKEIERNILPDTPLEPLLHLPTPKDTLRYPQTLRNHPWHILRHCHSSPRHSQASLTFNRHDLTLSFPPESSLTSLDNPNASQNVWRVFWSSQSCSWGSWGVFGVPGGVFWVSRGVLGVLEGVSGLWESSGSVFYSIPINIHGAPIKALTFSKRREGPRCLKYQNVPKLRSFWPIGKPWEMFQSWDIRVYFVSVPNDHTVAQTLQHSAISALNGFCSYLCMVQKLAPSW